ncbi:MAG: hypothetical protein ISQ89_01650 [Alphaproteobacteria bacterium]|jgi:hypothetical protein|nr:hypothetical protein [Alphaproteobacteria bacterium]MBL6850630.1 hypothetical protein [Alphaproteobacteria bacterium]
MKFNELKFINGICQLDYNYYVLSFTQQPNQDLFECTVFNRAKLPVDLPGVKTEKIKNNKWVKISLSKKDIERLILKFRAITGIKTPKHLEYNEFYKNIF